MMFGVIVLGMLLLIEQMFPRVFEFAAVVIGVVVSIVMVFMACVSISMLIDRWKRR